MVRRLDSSRKRGSSQISAATPRKAVIWLSLSSPRRICSESRLAWEESSRNMSCWADISRVKKATG